MSGGAVMVRPLAQAEVAPAMRLVRRVFLQFEAPEYPPEGVAEFMAFVQDEAIQAAMAAGRLRLWQAQLGGELAGVLALRPPGHISLLFVSERLQRRGVAKALFAAVLAQCQAAGCRALTVHSSPYAVPVYEKLGFAATGPQTVENGICYTPMRRPLAPPENMD